MKRTVLGILVGVWVSALGAFGQMPQGYLGVLTIHVKPDKIAQEIALARKLVDANRKNNGAPWIALADVYGESGTIQYVANYSSYADVEEQNKKFMAANTKALGPAGVQRLFQELGACDLTPHHAELRLRRWDLTVNPPANAAAFAKLVGNARWARTVSVHVRIGLSQEFEAQVLLNKAAEEKAAPNVTVLVSQAIAGQRGTVYYFTTLVDSLAAFDKIPTLRAQLGEEGYRQFLQNTEKTVSNVEFVIRRIDPSISNPPDEVAAVAPDFWRPKPPAAPKIKAESQPPAESEQK